MSLGVPLVVADTRVDRFYFDESLVRFFRAGDADDLARVLLDAYGNRRRSAEISARAQAYAGRNSWAEKKADYLDIVGRLLNA